MKIILGDDLGLIKEVNTKEKRVISSYGDIDPNKEMISIIKPSTSLNDNLLITELHEAYVLNWETKTKTASLPFTKDKNTAAVYKKIADQHIHIISKNNNTISIAKYDDDFKLNSHIENINKVHYNNQGTLRSLSNSSYGDKESIFCLYEDCPIGLYNISKEEFAWKAKNVPQDELGLRVPMYDTHACEVESNPRLFYASTAFGDIRNYDIKASSKPIANVNVSKNKINKMVLLKDNNHMIIGDTKGYAALLDVRKNMNLIKTFKGITSSVKDMIEVPDSSMVALCGFDRFVRWYDYKKGENEHLYVKNKQMVMCFIEKFEGDNEEEEEEDDDVEDEENEEDEFNEKDDVEEEEDQEDNDEDEEDDNDDDEDEEDEDEFNGDDYRGGRRPNKPKYPLMNKGNKRRKFN